MISIEDLNNRLLKLNTRVEMLEELLDESQKAQDAYIKEISSRFNLKVGDNVSYLGMKFTVNDITATVYTKHPTFIWELKNEESAIITVELKDARKMLKL